MQYARHNANEEIHHTTVFRIERHHFKLLSSKYFLNIDHES